MELRFLGGAKEVGRSCVLLSTEKTSILLDCGLKSTKPTKYPVFEDLPPIDAVIWSHAHIDHIGATPLLFSKNLVSSNFKGIFATPPTLALASILLPDSYTLALRQWHELGIEDLYQHEHISKTLASVKTVNLHRDFKIGDLEIKLYEAGHILGSCLIAVKAHGKKVVYTGNLGAPGRAEHLNPPEPVEGTNVLLLESTYGLTLQHPSLREAKRRLISSITETLKKGGKVLIPSFSVGRGQKVMRMLRKANLGCKVFYDGLLKDATWFYWRFTSYLSDPLIREVCLTRSNPFIDGIEPVSDMRLRKKIAKSKESCVILAPSGMLEGGWSPYYLKEIASCEENKVILVGHQGEDTVGEKLSKGERKVELHVPTEKFDWIKEEVEIRCEVDIIEGFSGHGAANDLRLYARSVRPNTIILHHGDPEALENLGEILKKDPYLSNSSIKILELTEIYSFGSKELSVDQKTLREILSRLDDIERRIRELEDGFSNSKNKP